MVDYETFIEYYSVVLRNSLHRVIEKCHLTNFKCIFKNKKNNYIANNSYLNYLSSSRQSDKKNSYIKIRSRECSPLESMKINSKYTSDTRYKSRIKSNEKNKSSIKDKSLDKINSKSTNDDFRKLLNEMKDRINSSEKVDVSSDKEQYFFRIEKCLADAVLEYIKENINLIFNLSLNLKDELFIDVYRKKQVIGQIIGEYISFLVYYFIKYLQNELIINNDEKLQIKEIIITIYELIRNSAELEIELILDSSKRFLDFFEEYLLKVYENPIDKFILERWDSIGTMKIEFNGKISKLIL